MDLLKVFFTNMVDSSLRKHAYSNILKILQPKKGEFSDKNSDIFHISAQNIDCGYSLEPPRLFKYTENFTTEKRRIFR